MDSAEFHAAVYDTVRLIPHGKVTSYGTSSPHRPPVMQAVFEQARAGHIAKLIGMPNHSRHVGQALKFLPANTNPPIPWQRVVASSGTISSRGPGTDGAQRQREALEAEGVEITMTRAAEMKIDLGRFGWFPSRAELSLEPAEAEESSSEEEPA